VKLTEVETTVYHEVVYETVVPNVELHVLTTAVMVTSV